MADIKKVLEGEITSEIKNLTNLKPGGEEHSAAVESLAKLYKLKIEEEKATLDFKEKEERRKMEEAQHQVDTEIRKEQSAAELEIKREQMKADADNHATEFEQKERQLGEQVMDRYFRVGLEAAGILLPLMFYAVWMKKGFKFEETGTFTSTTFKGLFNRFKPTKK